MSHLVDHAARVGRVLALHRVANPPQPHAPHDGRLVVLEADRALDQGHLDRTRAFGIRALIGHFLLCAGAPPPAPVPSPLTRLGLASSGCPLSERYPLKLVRSPSSLPRSRAISTGSVSDPRPANVARTTLCGFAEPSDFVRMFVMPADSTTARTAPPAMMPVPSGAGFSSTLPAPKLPTTRCGIVVPASGTRIRFFFAASIPFLIADGTSFALPTPKPTTPWPSPTTTSALKLRFLPPLTTFVTRLMETTVSLMSSCDGS